VKITARTAAIILPLFFFTGIFFTMVTGYWATESSKVPVRFTTGEAEGVYNPADIRGSYSLGDIEGVFAIPVDTLAKAFGRSDAPNRENIKLKEFEEFYGIIEGREVGTDSMRIFVAAYLGLPYVPEENSGLPQPAYNILEKEAGLSREKLEELRIYVVSLGSDSIMNDDGGAVVHDETADTTVKGKTTFADLYAWGLSEEQVKKAMSGLEPGARGVSVRDYCMENGIDFGTVKTVFQEMIDSQ
jgi:hypothetical protein